MKKYKLIKKYPNSPKLGIIVSEDGHDGNMTTWCNPLEYPEFWEEVIEKDYEVLELIHKISSKGYLQKDGNYSCTNKLYKLEKGHCTLQTMFGLGWDTIHSVKRLSDGEIFTIGDKVNHDFKDLPKYNNVQIISFKISGEKIEVYGNYNRQFPGFIYLEHLTKSKTPLFKTEDGIDIYEGDSFWYVNNIGNGLFKLNSDTAIKGRSHSKKVDGILDFSTKEKAEEYILMNKPCLSLKDVLELPNYVSHRSCGFSIKLTELVKTKL